VCSYFAVTSRERSESRRGARGAVSPSRRIPAGAGGRDTRNRAPRGGFPRGRVGATTESGCGGMARDTARRRVVRLAPEPLPKVARARLEGGLGTRFPPPLARSGGGASGLCVARLPHESLVALRA